MAIISLSSAHSICAIVLFIVECKGWRWTVTCWKSLRRVLYALMLYWSLNQIYISFFILYFLSVYIFYYFHYVDMYCEKTTTYDYWRIEKKKVRLSHIIYFRISYSWFSLELFYFLNIIKEVAFVIFSRRSISCLFLTK